MQYILSPTKRSLVYSSPTRKSC